MLKKSMLVILGVVLVAGCATTTSIRPEAKVLDKESAGVMLTVKAFTDALIAKDVNAIMATVAEDFDNGEATSKDEVQEFFEGAIAEGYLDDLDVYLDDLEIEVDGEEATAYQIDVSGNQGSASLDLWLKQEAGVWKIVDMQVIG